MFKNRTTIIVIVFCIIKLMFHLIADFNSGFQGDELLHIETGHHPAAGYMEFPPVIGWLAFIQHLFHSQLVLVHHIFPHLASLLILVVMAMITLELGGGPKAVFIVLLCILIAPCFGRSHQLFQPVVFSQFFWVLGFYQLLRFVKTPHHKYLLYLSVTIAFGFLTKYDILFFIAGLSALLLFSRTRRVLLSMPTLKYVLLFLLLISPNIYWQFQHDLPVLKMFARLYETQLDELTIAGVVKDLIISLNPLTALVCIAGLVFMLNKKNIIFYRPVAVSILVSILLLAFGKSKAYYFYPAMLTLLAFGSVWFGNIILAKRKWMLYPFVALSILSGLILMPFALSILPLKSFIKFAHIKEKDGRYAIKYSEYYARSKWPATLTAIKKVYDSLPPTERQECLLWGKHYSQAGAVNLYGQQYGLPKAFSYHGSFYLWTPTGTMPATIIAFSNGEAGIDFFQGYFNNVTAVSRVYNPYADFDKDAWQTIYVCKEPKQSFDGLKAIFRERIFE